MNQPIDDQVNLPLCCIPLNGTSQAGAEKVLYFNANAPLDDIYECANARLTAVVNLLESLYEFDKADPMAVQALSSVCALLLNDAMVMLEEFNPVATQLRKVKS